MDSFEPRKLPTVLRAEELLDKAFRKASKVGGRNKKEKTLNKLTTISNILSEYFEKIPSSHPSYDSLPDFYREIVDVVVGIRKLKKSLASLKWANEMVQKIVKKGIKDVKKGKEAEVVIRSVYGRVSSILTQIDSELRFLNEAKNKLKKIPTLTNDPTVVVAGYPNVGKSSFVVRISTVRSEVATYPFTTREIYVGYGKLDGSRVQIIDTPGLLDRPIHKRNPIERRAILCLKYLADCILFIVDPTETCGYPLKDQLSLLDEVKRSFNVCVIAAYSKSDMHDERDMPAFSNVTGEGIEKIVEMLAEVLKKERSKIASDCTSIQEGQTGMGSQSFSHQANQQ
jgi:nucleolar GTP-binding protein